MKYFQIVFYRCFLLTKRYIRGFKTTATQKATQLFSIPNNYHTIVLSYFTIIQMFSHWLMACFCYFFRSWGVWSGGLWLLIRSIQRLLSNAGTGV